MCADITHRAQRIEQYQNGAMKYRHNAVLCWHGSHNSAPLVWGLRLRLRCPPFVFPLSRGSLLQSCTNRLLVPLPFFQFYAAAHSIMYIFYSQFCLHVTMHSWTGLNTQRLVVQPSCAGCWMSRFTSNFGNNSPAQPVNHLTGHPRNILSGVVARAHFQCQISTCLQANA